MKKFLYFTSSALILAALHTPAKADESFFEALAAKDPLPDSLTWNGISLIATLDVGYAYESSGVPLNPHMPTGLDTQLFQAAGNRVNDKAQSTLAENGLSQSLVGIRIDEPVVNNVRAVGYFETAFQPLSGQIADACLAVAENGGKPYYQQNASADSSMCGQPFRQIYGGLKDPTWGEITFGRQNNVLLGVIGAYDPQALSYAFSVLGWSGSLSGGSGSTESARLDNSLKYSNRIGPVHFAAMFSDGGDGSGAMGRSIGGDIGVAYRGFSLDGVVQNTTGAINLRGPSTDPLNPLSTSSGTGVPAGLNVYLSNNTTWNILAKYNIDLNRMPDGSSDKLTLSGGYLHVQRAPNGMAFNSAIETAGAYAAFVGLQLDSDLDFDTTFVGLKYQLGPHWSFSGGYYRITQNSFLVGALGKPNLGCSTVGVTCAGTINEASGVIDYAINKHYDFYTGVNWENADNGLASGFPGDTSHTGTSGSVTMTSFVTGVRIRI